MRVFDIVIKIVIQVPSIREMVDRCEMIIVIQDSRSNAFSRDTVNEAYLRPKGEKLCVLGYVRSITGHN